uniref:NAD-dependent epimerase/dehydratase domain-containing protein n=1 Tax=Fagus sylvatica TaxID=28930 RepID=A0A2N9EGT9_FAGSY
MAAKESDRNEAATIYVAVIFGVTGLVGKELARRLILKRNWKVYGIARSPESIPLKNPNFHFISCDLLNPLETKQKLLFLQDVTHIFWITWASQFPLDSQECCEQNKDMMSNALNAILPTAKALKHVSLQTGTRECWEETYIDGSDARLVSEQYIWAATNDAISSIDGQAFNAINGNSFTWKEIWPALAMADKKTVWDDIVIREGLIQTEMEDLANWAFLDVLFRCPFKLLGTRDKADRLGFTVRYKELNSILYWIDFMRGEKLIP